MEKPSYDLGLQLNRNWIGLMAKLDHNGAVRLNERFNLVHDIAIGNLPAVATDYVVELVETIDIPATSEKFVASELFVENTDKRAAVKISFMSDEFKNRMLGKVEDPALAVTLRCHKLLKKSYDIDIIGVLGGVKKCEVGLVQIYAWMKQRGDHGGYAVFWVRDIHGELCAVRVFWHDAGWSLCVYSVGCPHGWLVGDLVFSSNS